MAKVPNFTFASMQRSFKSKMKEKGCTVCGQMMPIF